MMKRVGLAVAVLVVAAIAQGCDFVGWNGPDGYTGQLSAPTNTTTPTTMPVPPSSITWRNVTA